ncbi:MAG: Fic family protein [Bacillota bacterium]|nr:Fic family protein [Bacillota bacterium]
MKYLSVAEVAKLWNIAERTVRNYCAQGKIEGAFLTGKTWNIPATAKRPERINKRPNPSPTLLEILKAEKRDKIPGRIYHKMQIDFTYNSNHMEGSQLTHDQTRYIYETNTIGLENQAINVDDIVETVNHFRCVDFVINHASRMLTEKMIKEIHGILKNGTSDSRKEWFAVGGYKKLPNEVGGNETTPPERVAAEVKGLLDSYNIERQKNLEDILDFHVKFERIHPFQDGNGRVGRLILLKECLRNNIIPFIIDENLKLFYYRGIQQWGEEKGFLIDTCLTAQDRFKEWLDHFEYDQK